MNCKLNNPKMLAASAFPAGAFGYIFGDIELLKWLLVAVLIDLITGITKAWKQGGLKAVTSSGLRMTIQKFISYGSFLVIIHVLTNFTVDGKTIAPLGFVNNWAYTLLMLIEIKSVFENLVAINPALDFIKPLLEKISDYISKNKPTNEEKPQQ